jgi:hypothetical protein
MIQSVEEMITKYVAAWNNNTPEEFKVAFAECWAADGTYTDPEFELIQGVDGIAALAVESLKRVPSRKFSVYTQPEHHHNSGRYNWQVHLPEGDKVGFDYFEFNNEFKITRIVSFF